MKINVSDDTGFHEELADEIADLVDSVAPRVAKTTGLSLPPEAIFQLVTPEEWVRHGIDFVQRTIDRDIAELNLSGDTVRTLLGHLQASRETLPHVWVLYPATTIPIRGLEDAISLIVPQVWEYAGVLRDSRAKAQVVAHELAHQMQLAASGADPRWLTLARRQRGIEGLAVVHIWEGHARWVDQQVTAELFGRPFDDAELTRSRSYSEVEAAAGHAHRFTRDATRDGCAFVRQVVHLAGIEAINRMWKDPSLLPTLDEIATPESWVKRVET
ncbi:zinc-dependent metalloprotease [Streptomyces millisiae]|uniref:Zinc-dependent metalloprotease n=1 Tax=Streptomyces millisiae TaxID=3075542 RepID=A0ABU2LWA8_9ACTN|nr:zinc-dependent metalloprotease [Streptomyces sp. DSM 44918]MDT0321880.1 zinc-dependent metalloprotease [Streptomyces sp. DSM 44918]